MPDREKVMTWLEICGKNRDCSATCPYGDGSCEFEYSNCIEDLMADALVLLKEQEVKMGRWVLDDEDTNAWECSECGALQIIIDGTPFDNNWFYCPQCGCKMERQVSGDDEIDF